MAEHIDTSFDEKFNTIETLKWLPWVGKNYTDIENKRLLLVAESHYDWGEEGALDDLEYPEFTRWFISGHTVDNPNSTMNVLRNTERALFYGNPTNEQKISFWKSNGYFNIVQRILASRQERPNDVDYSIGWDTFFKVISILKPNYCLFCGVEASNFSFNFTKALESNNYKSEGIKWLAMVGNTYSRIANVESEDGYKCKLVFMKHPSSYFSWESWGDFIDEQMSDYTTTLT